MAFVVSTFDTRAGWPWAHIGKKQGEITQPSLTDRDSPATVVRKRSATWIGATLLHSNIGTIFRRQHSTFRMPMSEMSMQICLASVTTANNLQADQIVTPHNLGFPA
jgi:hypothetical protein